MLSVLGFGTTKQYSEHLHDHGDVATSVTAEITLDSRVCGSKYKSMLQDFVVSKCVVISIQSYCSLLFTLYVL